MLQKLSIGFPAMSPLASGLKSAAHRVFSRLAELGQDADPFMKHSMWL